MSSKSVIDAYGQMSHEVAVQYRPRDLFYLTSGVCPDPPPELGASLPVTSADGTGDVGVLGLKLPGRRFHYLSRCLPSLKA
jgi:hypothetical protein